MSHSLGHGQCVLYFKRGWCFSCDFLHLTIRYNRISKWSDTHYHQLSWQLILFRHGDNYSKSKIKPAESRLGLLGFMQFVRFNLNNMASHWLKKQKTKILPLPLRATSFRPHRSIEAESSAAAVPHRQPADTSPHATLHWPDLQSTVCLHRSAMKTRLNLTGNKG